jgi:hypothetical protein
MLLDLASWTQRAASLPAAGTLALQSLSRNRVMNAGRAGLDYSSRVRESVARDIM